MTASWASAARSASRHGTTTERTTDRAWCPPVGVVGGPDRGPGSDVAANVSTIPFVAARYSACGMRRRPIAGSMTSMCFDATAVTTT